MEYLFYKKLNMPKFKVEKELMEITKIACQPVAINSGYVWPKKGIKNKKKTITISILKPIYSGISRDEFLKKLENCIYTELDLLC